MPKTGAPHHADMLNSILKSYIIAVEWKIVQLKKSSMFYTS